MFEVCCGEGEGARQNIWLIFVDMHMRMELYGMKR